LVPDSGNSYRLGLNQSPMVPIRRPSKSSIKIISIKTFLDT